MEAQPNLPGYDPHRLSSFWPAPKRVVADILERAAMITGVPPATIRGADRHSEIVVVRQAVCWAAREQGLSYPRIGRELGGRHHTTIMSSVTKAGKLRVASGAFRALTEELVR